jgi:hypothetical protein
VASKHFVKMSADLRYDASQILPELKGAPLSVWLAIVSHVGYDGTCYPCEETIAEMTGYSKRQVTRSVSKLCRLGLLTVISYGKNKGKMVSNRYRVNKYFSYCTDTP